MQTILFIDGENFVKKIRAVFESENKPKPKFDTYNFRDLLDKVLKDIAIDKTIFYFAHLKEHPDTEEKSKQLIEEQRLLKNHLQQQNFEVALFGRVRGQIEVDSRGKKSLVFKEKGVDVKIAVDMVTAACDGKLKAAIIGSSDSDLQPAIAELKKRNVERIYLGFEMMPNKGLTYTTNRTILIRNSEVLEFAGK
ncbi:MAG: NYN domain-containing protein [Patescibacteria group bacterium]